MTQFARLFRNFRSDQSGGFAIMTALLMPVMIGFAGLGIDLVLWETKNRQLHDAADSGAISAATAFGFGNTSTYHVDAEAVTSSYGFVNGTNGVTVTVNRPPQSGLYAGVANAIEVIVMEPQPRFFTALWDSGKPPVSARAVALADEGLGCVLALNPNARGAARAQGSAPVNLMNCSLYDNSNAGCGLELAGSSSISARSLGVVGGICGEDNASTTHGVWTGINPVKDPYATTPMPEPADYPLRNIPANNPPPSLQPGYYPNGLQITSTTTLAPGIYIFGGDVKVVGGATLTGNGVTLVFTSSNGNNYAKADFAGGSTIDLTAPTSGPTAGIAIFGDRNMSSSTTFKFNGGSTQNIEGAVYVPGGSIAYAGGSSVSLGCTQLIADQVTFTGNSILSLNCEGREVNPIARTGWLVE